MAQQQQPSGGRGDAGTQNTRTADVPAGSRTQTEVPQAEEQPQAPILRLRGAQRNRGPRVQWAEGVVDNEGMGKKSSKVCCIYHRPKGVDESSDESSSDESSSSSSDDYDSDAGEGPSKHAHEANGDGDGKGCGHKHGRGRKRDGDGPKKVRKRSPNAYEKVPKPKPKPKPKPRDGGAGGSGPIGSG